MATKRQTDPVTMQIFRNALTSIADEMAVTVVRTSYSDLTRQQWDFSTGFADSQGRVVAQGLCVPLHMGSFPECLQNTLKKFKDNMLEGDVYVANDPYEGGMHLPDVYIFKPIFVGGVLQGIAIALNHFTEIGGRVAGGQGHDSSEIHQEGLRLPPIKLYDGGKPNEALFDLFGKNVRTPIMSLGDLRALVGACNVGEKGFLELIEEHGVEATKDYMEELLDYSEQLTRAEFLTWPDGTYEFTDHADDDGVNPEPIKIHVSITVDGDTLKVDFTGTDPQRGNSALNCTMASTDAVVYSAIGGVMSSDVPTNSGFYRPIETYAPPGSIVNAQEPAAVALRAVTAERVCDALYGALSKIVPDRVFACQSALGTAVFSGWDEDRNPVLFYDAVNGSWGGRPSKDGVDGISITIGNLSNMPIEPVEARQPVLIEEYGFLPDTGGPGKYRGGLSIFRQWQWLGDECAIQVYTDRQKFPPYGLYGGKPGTPCSYTIIRENGEVEDMPTKSLRRIKRGERLRFVMSGAGGWGDPLERETWRVLDDVRNGKVTAGSARDDYGVIVDVASMTVDEEATSQLRQKRSG